MVIDLKVLVRSFCMLCWKPSGSFFFEFAKVIFLTTSVCVCGVLTFCWTSAIRLPPPAVVLSLSTCLYQLVCINLSL